MRSLGVLVGVVKMVSPQSKKRKVETNGRTSSLKGESFSSVLEQLEAEEDASGGEQLHIDHIHHSPA